MLFIQRDKLISWTHDEKNTFFLTIREFDNGILNISISSFSMNFIENVTDCRFIQHVFLFINEK